MIEHFWVWPAALACVWGPAVVLLWRQIGAIQAMSGANLRALDRDRRDRDDLLLRLIEKRDSINLPETERRHLVHANEHMRVDAAVESEAVKSNRTPDPAKIISEFCSPEEAISD